MQTQAATGRQQQTRQALQQPHLLLPHHELGVWLGGQGGDEPRQLSQPLQPAVGPWDKDSSILLVLDLNGLLLLLLLAVSDAVGGLDLWV